MIRNILIAFTFVILASFLHKRHFFTDIDVTAYGAVGDSSTDNTTAINNASTAATSAHVGLYFPPGNYLVSTPDVNGNLINFQVVGDNITVHGINVKISTHVTPTTKAIRLFNISAFTLCHNFTITGITFQGQQIPYTTWGSSGVFITGTSGQLFQGVNINYCTFNGFQTDLGFQGGDHWYINRNLWKADNGHDCYNGTNPTCQIQVSSNTNGFSGDVNITNNIASGFTGAALSALTSKNCIDGFVMGVPWGSNVTGNTTKNFNQEHIFLKPFVISAMHTGVAMPVYRDTNVISGNDLNCYLPAGDMDGSSIHNYNYAIRVDHSRTTVDGNTIRGYTTGLQSRPTDWSGITFDTLTFINNKMYEAVSSSFYNVTGAVVTVGSIPTFNVNNNQIETALSSPFSITGTTNPVVGSNWIVGIGCGCFF